MATLAQSSAKYQTVQRHCSNTGSIRALIHIEEDNMNEQMFANVRLHSSEIRRAVLILSCFIGLMLVGQPSTRSQIGEQPKQGMLAKASIGVTTSNSNPLQIALLHWYDANVTTAFNVSKAPLGVAFDGANIWVTNAMAQH